MLCTELVASSADQRGPGAREQSELQPLAQHQKELPGFGRSVRFVYEKQPLKLNCMMTALSLIMLMR